MTRDEFVESSQKMRTEFPKFWDTGKLCCEYRTLYPDQAEFERVVRAQIKHEIRLMNNLMREKNAKEE